MARFTGKQYKGAQKEARKDRREEAEARNALHQQLKKALEQSANGQTVTKAEREATKNA